MQDDPGRRDLELLYRRQRTCPRTTKGERLRRRLDMDRARRRHKLIASWYVGGTQDGGLLAFMEDLKGRARWPHPADDRRATRPTRGGRRPGLPQGEIDWAQLIKTVPQPSTSGERRYSPPVCTGPGRSVLQGRPGPGEGLNELRRAPEPHDADGDAPVHTANQRLLKEDREPHGRRRDPLHALQLRPPAQDAGCQSPDPSSDARDGRWRRRSRLEPAEIAGLGA